MLTPVHGALGPLAWRRGGGAAWTPAALPNMAAWFKGDAITGLSNGAAISSWVDSSGSGRDAFQGIGSQQPKYKPAQLNGLPVVRFNPANSTGLEIPNLGAALSGDNTHSIFFVAKPLSTDQYPVLLTWPVSTGWQYLMEYNIDGKFYWGTQGGGGYILYNSSFTTVAWTLASCVKSSSSVQKFFSAGTELASFSGSTGATLSMTGNMLLGGYFASPSFGMDGDVAEFLVFTDALSDSNRQKVEGYLAWKWGLVSQLPSDHPYKGAAP